MEISRIIQSSSLALSCAIFIAHSTPASAQCVGLAKGPVVVDVKSCKAISPKDDFNKDFNFTFLKGMTPPDRAKFLASYKGLLLNGMVVKSEAVKIGFDDKKGALMGESLKFFTSSSALTCEALSKKRLAAVVEEHCCSGSADVPCLLATTYVLNDVKPIGAVGSAEGDKERKQVENLPGYQAALEAFKKKDYKVAVKHLEELRRDNKLDVRGHFLLGLSYRNLDECAKAIVPLQVVFDRAARKDVWADQANIVRRSNFLLARCFAKVNNPGRATIILSSYLIEPEKYKIEIRQSLKHPDFGFINASKEYGDYRTEARKKIGGADFVH